MMVINIIAFFVSAISVFVPFLVILWVWGGVNLYQKIKSATEKEALPMRWKLLCVLPGFGHWFFNGYQNNWQPFKLLHKKYEIKVTRDVSEANWLIIQEHIDDPLAIRKGSTLTALRSNVPAYLFSEVDGLPNEDSFVIRVTTPRKSYDEPEWAKMTYCEKSEYIEYPGWVVQNLKSNIPILIKKDREFYSIASGSKSDILSTNTKLFMGTATFSIVELPDIGVRNNDDETSSVVAGIVLFGANPNCNFCVNDSIYSLAAIFDKGDLTVYGSTSVSVEGYSGNINLSSRVERRTNSSITYKLFVGDKFNIESMQFVVDYL